MTNPAESASKPAETRSHDAARRVEGLWPIMLSVGIFAAGVVAYFAHPPLQHGVDEAWQVLRSGDRGAISGWVQQYGVWGPVVIVVAMTVQMFLIVIPSAVLMAVAVVAYGAGWGTLLAIGAVLVASTVGYLVGWGLGAQRMQRWLGQRTVARTEGYIERYGGWTVFVFRLSPFLSNDAISFVAGLLGMRFWKFLVATLAGITPLAIAIGVVGRHTEQMTTAFGWISGVSLVLLAGFVWYDRRQRHGR